MQRHVKSLLCLILILGGVIAQHATGLSLRQNVDFNREIKPLLTQHCTSCHGEKKAAAQLRLHSKAAALKGGLSGPVILAGNSAASLLLQRVQGLGHQARMPLGADALTPLQIETLRKWIDEGAVWPEEVASQVVTTGKPEALHWAYRVPQRAALPQVKNEGWVRNEIDRFILARLEKEGMGPSREADRATLLRRVSLDLTGLPPTLKELDAFLQDTSSDAYEKVVDRLLASPRYGERMAFVWLNAARYADTNGYQIDGNRSAWRWRDWVIEAFNSNQSYDQFVIEQLAGDLLPHATLSQQIATAFNRHHRINAEGGIVPEEYRNEYVVDRVDTTSTVFMGLTLGCARCHNHKYDPLTQKEYYQVSAYFNSIDEDGHSFDQGNSPPWIKAPTAAQQLQLESLDRALAQTNQQFRLLTKKYQAQQREWEKSLLASSSSNVQQGFLSDNLLMRFAPGEHPKAEIYASERTYHDQYDKKPGEPLPEFKIGYRDGTPQLVKSPAGNGAAFDGRLYYDAGMHADFRYKTTSKDYQERFSIVAWVYPEVEQSGSIVTKVSDSPAEIENNVPRAEGYGLYFLNGKINFNMVFRWGEDALRIETGNPLPLKQWSHVAVVFDGTRSWEDRIKIYVNGEAQPLTVLQRNFFLFFGGTRNTLKIGAGGGPQFRFKGALDEVRLYNRLLSKEEIGVLACADSLSVIAAITPQKRTPAQSKKIFDGYLANAAPVDLRQCRQQQIDLEKERIVFEDTIQTLMVMQELLMPRPTFLLRRGAYDAPGEKVARGVPAILPALASGNHLDPKSNRLDFARWLVSPANPLTARVAVNRYWQMLFGTGIIKTVDDFGSQGEAPSHPELLDYLAVTFQEGASSKPWDIKRLLKLMIMSATYRQAANTTAEHQQVDPENRLLARGPRLRLSAEMIRDQALFVSGLLVEKIGGPSVKPYQPTGLYKDMAFSGLTDYAQDHGEGLYRRSLYTFWKRTMLSPTMQVFDASAREFCTVRESRTNTPLQSLNLMNDVTYLEAARFLAQRMILEGGATAAERVNWGFRTVTARFPTQTEKQLLQRSLEQNLAHFIQVPGDAKKLLTLGEKESAVQLNPTELAAYTTIASLILNLDETINK